MSKQLVLLELTVPWEERMEEAHERNTAKYQALMDECRQQRWKTWNLPVEVCSRGFAGQSLWRAFSILGITEMARRRAIRQPLNGCGRRESSDGQLHQFLAKTEHPMKEAST